MRVLEPPIVWILVAVVLVALAAALIVIASLRRSSARRRAAARGPAAALEPARPTAAEPDPETVPIDLTAARAPSTPPAAHDDRTERPAGTATDAHVDGPPRTTAAPAPAPDLPPEDEPLAAPLFRPWTMQPRAEVRTAGAHPRHALIDEPDEPDEPAVDDAPTDDVAVEDAVVEDAVVEEAPADRLPVGDAEPEEHAGASPPADGAKDRLLAVLLRDPEAALRALGSEGHGGGASAAQLLRAGLSPAQVARLVGVGEDELAAVVAHGLGLLGRGQDAGQDTGQDADQDGTGTSRTEEPGRSWANAGSAAGATTPTTG